MASVRIAFEFPAQVNDTAARIIAGGVAAVAAVALLTGWLWLTLLLTLGFALRVAFGPRWSPLGRLAGTVLAPRLGAPRWVPGPPKRFAQGVGLALTGVATLALAAGASVVTVSLLVVLLVFAIAIAKSRADGYEPSLDQDPGLAVPDDAGELTETA